MQIPNEESADLIYDFRNSSQIKFCRFQDSPESNISYGQNQDVCLFNNKIDLVALKLDLSNKIHYYHKYKRGSETGSKFFISSNFFNGFYNNLILYSTTGSRFSIEDFNKRKLVYSNKNENLLKTQAFDKMFMTMNVKGQLKLYDVRDPKFSVFDSLLSSSQLNCSRVFIKDKTVLIYDGNESRIFDIRKPDDSINLAKLLAESYNDKIDFQNRKSIMLDKDNILSLDFYKNKLENIDIKKGNVKALM